MDGGEEEDMRVRTDTHTHMHAPCCREHKAPIWRRPPQFLFSQFCAPFVGKVGNVPTPLITTKTKPCKTFLSTWPRSVKSPYCEIWSKRKTGNSSDLLFSAKHGLNICINLSKVQFTSTNLSYRNKDDRYLPKSSWFYFDISIKIMST